MSDANGVEAPSELESRVIKQIEYYFGDVNLAKDKFMQEELKKDEGWISLETMLNFNRLKAITEDQDAVAAAISKSKSGLMEVSEDKKKIRRDPAKTIPEFTKERKDDLKIRTVYVKGFPTDGTLDTIQEFMEKVGPVEHIQMRRNQEREFKGSVFVLYKNPEDADKFLTADEYKTYKDEELVRLKKDDYFKQKMDEKKKLKEDEINQGEKQKKQREDQDKNKLLEKITKQAVMEVKGLPEGMNREKLKQAFDKYSKVAWVDFDLGDTEAKVRFEEENAATTTIEKMKTENDGKFMVNDKEVEVRLLEGEEELQHWRERFRAMRDRREEKRNKRTQSRSWGRRGGGRGGRKYGGGSRRRSKQDDEDDDADSGAEDGAEAKKMEPEEDKAVKRSHEETVESEEPAAKQTKTDS